MYYPIATNYDAWVRTYPGQNVWRTSWASYHGRNSHIGVVNPMMMVWGANATSFLPGKWAFPVTEIYSIAQETWTGDTQRARRRALTFYGKGCVRPEVAVILLGSILGIKFMVIYVAIGISSGIIGGIIIDLLKADRYLTVIGQKALEQSSSPDRKQDFSGLADKISGYKYRPNFAVAEVKTIFSTVWNTLNPVYLVQKGPH